MKKTTKHTTVLLITLLLLSCREYVREYSPAAPHIFETEEPKYIELPKTTGQFRKIEFEAGYAKNYAGQDLKVFVFPKSLELKSLYIPVREDGSFTIEYKYERNQNLSNETEAIGELILMPLSRSALIRLRLLYNPQLNEQ